jgi:16S rRNA processing protein RimM
MVVLGEVTCSYGVKGWLKVRPFTSSPDALHDHAVWWLRRPQGGEWTAHARRDGRMHSGAVLVELEGVTTREVALGMKGMEVAVPRTALPAAGPDEFFWDELTGFAVVNQAGVPLGSVAGMTEHGAHPLLLVARSEGSPGAARLIPFVPAIVVGVDRGAGRIVVDWGDDY